jgi:hypothetical protein
VSASSFFLKNSGMSTTTMPSSTMPAPVYCEKEYLREGGRGGG